jgi:hypothetical protein
MSVCSLAACLDSFSASERKIIGCCVCQFCTAKPGFPGIVQLELAKGTGPAVGPQEADGEADSLVAAGGAAVRQTAVEAAVARPQEGAQQVAAAFEQVARAVVEAALGAVGPAVPAY